MYNFDQKNYVQKIKENKSSPHIKGKKFFEKERFYVNTK